MRNTKRISITALVMCLMLAACSDAPTPAPEPTLASESSSAIMSDMTGELTVFTIGGPPAEAVNAMKAAFMLRFPNVTVKVNVQDVRLTPSAINPQDAGQFAFGLMAQQKQNKLEDVFFNADLFVPQLVDAGVALDMEPLAKTDAANALADIYPGVLNLGKLPNQPGVFMVPMGLETVQMYYNKTLFEKAGAPLPTATTTWDDFLESCKRIREYKPDARCFDFEAGTWWPYFLPWIVGYGGSPLSDDGKTSTLGSPASRAGLTAYANLWNVKAGAATQVYERGRNCFVAQRCAAMFQISSFIPAIREFVGNRFEWDVQRVPAHPEGQWTGLTSLGFSINKNAKNPQMAWEFVKLLANPDVQLELFKRRQAIPMLQSLSTHPDVTNPMSDLPPANIAAFVGAGEMGIVPPVYPLKCGSYYSGVVLESMTKLLNTITADATTVLTATQIADTEIQACLNE
jgi:ABC-type glycerol-3-phosphate transport system substrate-binding protein